MVLGKKSLGLAEGKRAEGRGLRTKWVGANDLFGSVEWLNLGKGTSSR